MNQMIGASSRTETRTAKGSESVLKIVKALNGQFPSYKTIYLSIAGWGRSGIHDIIMKMLGIWCSQMVFV